MKKIMMAVKVPLKRDAQALPFRFGVETGGETRPLSALPRRARVMLRREGDSAVFLWRTERHTLLKTCR